MSANVRCAGGGWWNKPAGVGANRRILYRETTEPCGWEGTAELDPTCICGDSVRLTNAMPNGCPNCRGQVELIDHTQEVER